MAPDCRRLSSENGRQAGQFSGTRHAAEPNGIGEAPEAAGTSSSPRSMALPISHFTEMCSMTGGPDHMKTKTSKNQACLLPTD